MPATIDLISLYNRCQAEITNMEIPTSIRDDTEFTAKLARVQRDLQVFLNRNCLMYSMYILLWLVVSVN